VTDRNKGKMKIFQDEVKIKHTSHWDVDAMSRAELEAYMRGELGLPSQNVHEAAAAEAAANEVEAQGQEARANAGGSLWTRFMRACLQRS